MVRPVLRLDADLAFSVEDGPQRVSGSIRASGRHVELRADGLASVLGGTSNRDVRRFAVSLAKQGVTIAIGDSTGSAVTMGDLKAPLLSRVLSRSRHIRIDNLRAAAGLARAQRRASRGPALLESVPLPPPTMWPIFPTAHRRSRVVTTTHDPEGGGNPRLYISDASDPLHPGRVGVFHLPKGTTRIGSAEDMNLVLHGVDQVQAEIVRTDDDEYELVALSQEVLSTVGGRQLPRQQLRTGARIQLGPWRLTYVRDEYADHGRPYGGRMGGELGRQRTQPKPSSGNGARPAF